MTAATERNDIAMDLPRRVYVPAAIGHEPTTVAEALRSAHALLDEEGRWAQHVFYDNKAAGTDEYIDNPYCNGWGTCAIGALQCVTLGVERFERPNYLSPFDHDAGSWQTCHLWQAPEKYSGFIDGYATDDEWAALDGRERIYVEAHNLLDIIAAEGAADRGTFDSVIGLNDHPDTTRADVLEVFRLAAERADIYEKAAADG